MVFAPFVGFLVRHPVDDDVVELFLKFQFACIRPLFILVVHSFELYYRNVEVDGSHEVLVMVFSIHVVCDCLHVDLVYEIHDA